MPFQDPRKVSALAVFKNNDEVGLCLEAFLHLDEEGVNLDASEDDLFVHHVVQAVVLFDELLALHLHGVLLALEQVLHQVHLTEGTFSYIV